MKAVVATVSLGVGVDIRVKNVVCFGLGTTIEDTVQEAGRCMRGNTEETREQRGLAFFFQKGSVAALHCSPMSDCRSLITEPLPRCQTTTLFKFFDPNFEHNVSSCYCCYSCILRDAQQGCQECSQFLELYLSQKKMTGISRSTVSDLKAALLELFIGLGLAYVEVESKLQLKVPNFIDDLVKAFDEISSPNDISEMWHVNEAVAADVYNVCTEVLNVGDDEEDSESGNNSEHSEEESSESSGFSYLDPDYEDAMFSE